MMKTVRWNIPALIVFVSTCALLLLIFEYMNLISNHDNQSRTLDTTTTLVRHTVPASTKSHGHKLAIIIPFRDRFEELLEFVPHLHSFLTNASINHRIMVINQADKLRFNRAALINIGYHLSLSDCDYLAMHDVDLLPANPALNYKYPDGYVYHLAAPHLHPLYHYKTFVGGILLLTHKHFQLVNGLSNRYWGWGREDDEFYVRLKEANLEIRRPTEEEIRTGYNTFRHIHDRVRRPRDNKRYGNQKAAGSVRDRKTGANTVKYNLTETYDILIKGAPAIVYNVELGCNRDDTPWCEVPAK